MKERLLGLLVGLALFCDGAQCAPSAPVPFGTPFVPPLDSQVLQEVPARSDPAVQGMRLLRAKFSASPRDLTCALSLAESYIAYGRQVGDAHYAGYAEAVIAPWVNTATPPPAVLVLQATILQFRHQFDEARTYLQAALKADPANAQAWMTQATLDMVQGRYEAAGKDCAQVSSHANFSLGLACAGNLRSYVGHAEQAMALLQQAASGLASAPVETRAWLQGLLAENAERLGNWPEAESRYRQALTLTPQDNFLLVAYADFLLDRDRAQEVPALLQGHEQSDTAYLRIALARSALHSPSLPKMVWIMAARFDALAQRGSDFFGREQARFALQLQHDPAGALRIALQNWRVQRAPWDARMVLEAALAAKQPDQAAATLKFVQQTQLQDPLIASLVRQLKPQLSAGTRP